MKTKHYPSPWTFDNEPDGENSVTIEHEGCPICVVHAINDFPCATENEEEMIESFKANAKLIASAPELLSALQGFIHSVEHEGEIHGRIVDAIRNAKEAISKATGK